MTIEDKVKAVVSKHYSEILTELNGFLDTDLVDLSIAIDYNRGYGRDEGFRCKLG